MFQRDFIIELFNGPGLSATQRRLLIAEPVRVRQMACRTRPECPDSLCHSAPTGALRIKELAEQQVECRDYVLLNHPLLDTTDDNALPSVIADAVLDMLDALADLRRFARHPGSPALPSAPMWHVMAARAASVHAQTLAEYVPLTAAQIHKHTRDVVREVHDSPEFVATWLDQVALSSHGFVHDSEGAWKSLTEELLRQSHASDKQTAARLTLEPLWREVEDSSPWAWVEFPADVVWAEYPPVGLSPVHSVRFPRFGIVPAEMRFTYRPHILEVFSSRSAALAEWEQFGGAEGISRVVSLCRGDTADFPSMRAALQAASDQPS